MKVSRAELSVWGRGNPRCPIGSPRSRAALRFVRAKGELRKIWSYQHIDEVLDKRRQGAKDLRDAVQ